MEHRIRVRPEDLYNEQTILAAQEGRLFIDLKTDTIDRETINNNVRAREKGVYEQYSDRHFDALLEPDVEESPYRRFLSQGVDNRSLVLAIRDIVANMNV